MNRFCTVQYIQIFIQAKDFLFVIFLLMLGVFLSVIVEVKDRLGVNCTISITKVLLASPQDSIFKALVMLNMFFRML